MLPISSTAVIEFLLTMHVLICVCWFSGLALEFATHLFRSWLVDKDINNISQALKRAGLEGKLLVSDI